MHPLRAWFLLPSAAVWLMTGGCDSDTDAASGAGGAAAGQGGEPPMLAGGGAGDGGSAGQGGAGPLACPINIISAEGEDCSGFGEGFECSDGGTNPCEFGNAIVCTDGAWERRESFPAPCGGAGGSDFGP